MFNEIAATTVMLNQVQHLPAILYYARQEIPAFAGMTWKAFPFLLVIINFKRTMETSAAIERNETILPRPFVERRNLSGIAASLPESSSGQAASLLAMNDVIFSF